VTRLLERLKSRPTCRSGQCRFLRTGGYSFVELLVVSALLAVLASAVLPLTKVTVQRQREAELRHALRELRTAIDRYKDSVDLGMIGGTSLESENQGYPPTLETLVEGVERVNDASGGKISLGGSRSLDNFITDGDTTLKILGHLELSRTDSGTNTVGDLEFQQMSPSPPHLSVSEMGLNIAKAAQISGVSLSLSNGGELILQEDVTFENSNVDFNDFVFKPTGSVSVTNSGFNLHGTSSVVLQGDTTFSHGGDIYWPGLDLNGNSLTFGGEGANISIGEALNIAN